jgi:cytochrome P450
MEGQLILARILSRYEVIASGSHPVSAHIGTTLRPKDGVWVTLRKRTPQPSGHATAEVPPA